jgi:hypothetical protein
MTAALPDPDDDHTGDPIHERAEDIAVPDFDFVAAPLAAIVDAATGHAPEHEHHEDEDGEPEE